MSDKFLNIDLLSDSEADLDLAVTHVRGEDVIAYPPETVYGFGSRPTTKGVSRVQALKRRTRKKPLIILSPTAEEVAG